VYAGLAIIWIIITKVYQRCRPKKSFFDLNLTHHSNQERRHQAIVEGNSIQGGSQKPQGAVPNKPPRVKALDTFRGISLIVMIFVNYGGNEFN
jgi:hypothetical protein